MGAISNGKISVSGLKDSSKQGDRAIIDLLTRFGASVTHENGKYTVTGGYPLCGIDIDASQIPDLVPVLAAVASVASGTTVIYNASRLRLKESDRIASVCSMLWALGADAIPTEDGLVINGKPSLLGGTVDACNDHRIAMSATVAAVVCKNPVTVTCAECTSKSYPDFWDDIEKNLHVALK